MWSQSQPGLPNETQFPKQENNTTGTQISPQNLFASYILNKY